MSCFCGTGDWIQGFRHLGKHFVDWTTFLPLPHTFVFLYSRWESLGHPLRLSNFLLFFRRFIRWLHSLSHSWLSWGKNIPTTLHHSQPQLNPLPFLGKWAFCLSVSPCLHDERLTILICYYKLMFIKPSNICKLTWCLKSEWQFPKGL